MNMNTPKPTTTGTNNTAKAMMLMSMVMTGTITLSEDDVNAISRILLSALAPASPTMTMIPSKLSLSENNSRRSTVRGLAELAEIIGVSLPTACKLSKSGKFAAAELNFGTKKKVWDKTKLLEIASHSQGDSQGENKNRK